MNAAMRALIGPPTAEVYDDWAASLLALARAESGLSQAALADRAGVAESTVQRIERGTMQPTTSMLLGLLAATGKALRVALVDFDAHDRILDERATAFPGRAAGAQAQRDYLVDHLVLG